MAGRVLRESASSIAVTVPENTEVKQGDFVVLDYMLGMANQSAKTGAGETAIITIDRDQNKEFETNQIAATGTYAVGTALYWDAAEKKFTENAADGANDLVGTVTTKKNANGYIGLQLLRPPELGTAALVALRNYAGTPFMKIKKLTAAAAGTAVEILSDAEVGAGRKVFITDVLANVSGATAWTDETATGVTIQDTATSPVVAVTLAKNKLEGNAVLGKHSDGVTLGANVLKGTGLTEAKGIVVKGDANFAAGSDIYVTVTGYIA